MPADQQPLWTPTAALQEQSRMRHYMQWLREQNHGDFSTYAALYNWSVSDPSAFWQTIPAYFGIPHEGTYEQVMQQPPEEMIGTRWFEGMKLSYAEQVFSKATSDHPAIIASGENGEQRQLSWSSLKERVALIATWMRAAGIRRGDRVAAVMPNTPETVVLFLAANSLGAVWSSCSPDFGEASIVDRFAQIEPKLVFVTDQYQYNGKVYPKIALLQQLRDKLPTALHWVTVPFEGLADWTRILPALPGDGGASANLVNNSEALVFERLPFDHPIWILYSSGTTGKPKAITHSTGGIILEHLKALALHQDVHAGEKYFWYSTTGWMMWNYALGSLLCGATLVMYEGSAGYPDLGRLWRFASDEGVHHFGGGAAYYIACMKAGLSFPPDQFPVLRTIGSTGSPLPPQAFRWIYESVKSDVWLISLSGGTDICSAFVGGSPLLPVYEGEIQCRMLGCDLESLDERGKPLRESLGEMVIRQPMPSMPVFFWGDEGHARYRASYFDTYPGLWRHGDYIRITDRGTIVIFGRSDATLNRDGVRIGTAEIYQAIESSPYISDSLVVCLEKADGKFYMPLFVVMREGVALTPEIVGSLKQSLRSSYSPRHVPDEIISVPAIPYTISGKKMEAPVKKILMGMDPDKVASRDTMRNPEALEVFVSMRGDGGR